MNDTGRLEMLPFSKQYVPTVNIKDGFIIVEMLNFAAEEDGEPNLES